MRIYIAAPYTQGNIEDNIRRVIDTADALVIAGHTPYIPHLTHWWHIVSPKPYDFWIEYDKTFITHWAEALLRLPGASDGADNEVKLAKELGLTIYYSIKEFYFHCPEVVVRQGWNRLKYYE